MAWEESPNISKKAKIPHASKKFIWKKKEEKENRKRKKQKEGKKREKKKKFMWLDPILGKKQALSLSQSIKLLVYRKLPRRTNTKMLSVVLGGWTGRQ